MDCVVEPLDQVFPPVALDVSTTLPPMQKVVGPLAVMVGVKTDGKTLTETGEEVEEQPLLPVTVTE